MINKADITKYNWYEKYKEIITSKNKSEERKEKDNMKGSILLENQEDLLKVKRLLSYLKRYYNLKPNILLSNEVKKILNNIQKEVNKEELKQAQDSIINQAKNIVNGKNKKK